MAFVLNRANMLAAKKSDLLNQEQGMPQNQPLQTSAASTIIAPNQGTMTTGVGQAPTDYTKSNFSSAKKILDANRGDAAPSLLGTFQAGAAKEKASLQEQSNNWAKGVGDKNKVLTGDVNRAVTGDQGQYDAVRQGLDQTFFEPEKLNLANPSVLNEEQLRSQSGREALLSQQRGGNYNQGFARLDSLLFKNSNKYGEDLSSLSNLGKELRDEKAKLEADSGKFVDTTKAAIEGNKAGLRSQLTTKEGDIRGAVKAQTEAFHASKPRTYDRSGFDATLNNWLLKNPDAQRLWEIKNPDFKPIQDRFRKELQDVNTDPFYREGNVSGESVTADQSAEFNRIMTLLGKGDVLTNTAQMDQGIYDTEGYSAALDEAYKRARAKMGPTTMGIPPPGAEATPIADAIDKAARQANIPPHKLPENAVNDVLNKIPDDRPVTPKGGTYDPNTVPVEREPIGKAKGEIRDGAGKVTEYLDPRTSVKEITKQSTTGVGDQIERAGNVVLDKVPEREVRVKGGTVDTPVQANNNPLKTWKDEAKAALGKTSEILNPGKWLPGKDAPGAKEGLDAWTPQIAPMPEIKPGGPLDSLPKFDFKVGAGAGDTRISPEAQAEIDKVLAARNAPAPAPKYRTILGKKVYF